jgi:damage-control phosphatase, subfamily I
MRIYLDCFPCFLRQTLEAVRFVTTDETIHEEVVRQVLALIGSTDARQTPPAIGQQIHRVIRWATGNADPYRQRKYDSNLLAMRLYPQLKDRIRGSRAPLEMAVRLAIAGNVMDFGLYSSLGEREVLEAVETVCADGWDSDCLNEFAQAVNEARKILYLGDNAGEIVFDRLLIEELPHEKVIFAVKGSPVLNDVTREDAAMTGLTDLVEVVENGCDAPGTLLGHCSVEFRQCFEQSDLIIAKGQGNYESLNEVNKNMFFLLKAKCPVVARDLSCDVGQMVLCRGGRGGKDMSRPRKEQIDARL